MQAINCFNACQIGLDDTSQLREVYLIRTVALQVRALTPIDGSRHQASSEFAVVIAAFTRRASAVIS
jgi:hypothetical protein